MVADLHTHTDASFDSHLSFDERIELAEEAGIETIALTDHNAVHPRLRKREEEFNGIKVITGIEITSFGEFGRLDILGFFVDPETVREKVRGEHRMNYRHAIRKIHDAGGVAVLAHPGRYEAGLEELLENLKKKRLDGIELEYPYEKLEVDFNQENAHRLAGEKELVTTGGSDCHGGNRKAIGEVKVEEECIRELREIAERYQD